MANSAIPEELVVDILKRLPVKSLMRFQCVSPNWRALIKSPFFRNKHIKHQKLLKNESSSRSKEEKDEYILILSSPDTEDGYVGFTTLFRGHGGELLPPRAPTDFPVIPHSEVELCAPSNGIFSAVVRGKENAVYLCNPATRETCRIPDRPFGFKPKKFPKSGVSYVERAAWGFGLDARRNELKFVSVMYYGTPGDKYYFDVNASLFGAMIATYPDGIMPHGILQFEVYELSSNTWREVKVALPDTLGLVNRKRNQMYVYSLDLLKGGGVVLNGCIHWLYGGTTILCFDLSSEVMRVFEIEGVVGCVEEQTNLVVLGGSLALVADDPGQRNCVISVWVMEEYGVGTSWVKRFKFAPSPVTLYPLPSWKDEDGDLLLFQYADPSGMETLISCNGFGCSSCHMYPIRQLDEPEPRLALRAIVVSGFTLVSAGPTT